MQGLSTLAATVMPAKQADPFLASLNHLSEQMSQGGAIGLTALPTYKAGTPAVVAIFQVKDADDAKGAIRDFVREFTTFRQEAMGGGMAQFIELGLTPDTETTRDIPVDLLKLTVRRMQPVPNEIIDDVPVLPDDGIPPDGFDDQLVQPDQFQPPQMELVDIITQEFRVAYAGDKMLVVFGANSKDEMTLLINRVLDKTPGFTASAKFKALKANAFPAAPYAFSYVVPGDLVRTVASLLPSEIGNEEQLQMIIGILPPQRTALYGYTEVKDGMIYNESRIPMEQLDLLYIGGKALLTFRSMMAPTEEMLPPGDDTPQQDGDAAFPDINVDQGDDGFDIILDI
jgi:hypothetical protein